MPPINPLVSFAGIEKQAGGAKGGASASPVDFGFGVLDGKIFEIPITQEAEEITLNGAASDRFAPAVNRIGAMPGAAFKTRAWAKSLGLLLYGVCGSISTAGVGPFTHTISPAQTLIYNALYARMGATALYQKVSDFLIDELTIGMDERNPCELDIVGHGLVPAFQTAAWTATNDESTQPFFGPNAGLFTLDVNSGAPAAAQVSAASVHIANNLKEIPLSKSILPDDFSPGRQQMDGSITIIPNNFNDFHKIVTGSAAGTTLLETPIYGSFSLKWIIDANNELTIAANRVAFMTEWPDSDPEGDPVALELAFEVIRPTDGSAAFTVTLKNQQATY